MKPRKRINPISERQKERLKLYEQVKKEWWKEVEGLWCPVMLTIFGRRVKVRDLHHKNGKAGSLLWDKNHFLAVSREGHAFIHDHPDIARENKWLCERGDWNKP